MSKGEKFKVIDPSGELKEWSFKEKPKSAEPMVCEEKRIETKPSVFFELGKMFGKKMKFLKLYGVWIIFCILGILAVFFIWVLAIFVHGSDFLSQTIPIQSRSQQKQSIVTQNTKVVQRSWPLGSKAEVLVEDVEWNYSRNEFYCNLHEIKGWSVVFDRVETRIWKLQKSDESPQVFKQREPHYWTRNVHLNIRPFQRYCGKDRRSDRCVITLENYRAWLQEIEWIEVKLLGKDARGNEVSVVLETYDH